MLKKQTLTLKKSEFITFAQFVGKCIDATVNDTELIAKLTRCILINIHKKLMMKSYNLTPKNKIILLPEQCLALTYCFQKMNYSFDAYQFAVITGIRNLIEPKTI